MKRKTSKESKRPQAERARVRRGNAEDREALKRELIDAALRLFTEGGIEAVKMRAVAEQIGVSPMALYRYFADKAELLSGLWTFALEAVYEVMERAAARPGSARERQAAVIEAFLDYWEAHPDQYWLVYSAQGGDRRGTAVQLVQLPAYARLLSLAERVTLGLAQQLGVGAEHVKLASDVRFAMQLGYLNGLMANRRYPWSERALLRRTYVEQVVATVERCLRDGPPPAPTD